MVRVVGLKKQSKTLLDSYVTAGVLRKSQVYNLWKAETRDDIFKALSVFVTLDADKILKIWSFVIHNVWVGVYDKDDKDSVFNEYENIFFRELLNCKGLISKIRVLDSVLKTPHQTKVVVENLQEMGLVDVLSLNNGEVLYLLNLKFYDEVFRE